MSSSTASTIVESSALGTLTTTEIGSPPRSPTTCSFEPALPRSTRLAPIRSPLTAHKLKLSTLTRSRSTRA